MTREEHIEISKGKARERIASARSLIEQIESGKITFHQQIGGESMRDTTAETLAEQRQRIKQDEELLQLYEGDHA